MRINTMRYSFYLKEKRGQMKLFRQRLGKSRLPRPSSTGGVPPSQIPVQEPLAVIGGRQMRTDAPYALPKDLQEMHRLDFQHFILRQALRGNYLSPLEDPLAILDVGCGTGRWCYEMAQAFPRAHVIGCDLVEPTTDLEKNYQFVQGDVLKHLPFSAQTFDLVHQRLLFLAIPTRSWPDEVR